MEKKTAERAASNTDANANTNANTNTNTIMNTHSNVISNANSHGVNVKTNKGGRGGLTRDGDGSGADAGDQKESGSGTGTGSRVGKRSGLGIGNEAHRRGNSKERKGESTGEHRRELTGRGEPRGVYRGEKIAADQLEAMETALANDVMGDSDVLGGDVDDDDDDDDDDETVSQDVLMEEVDSESALRKLTQL